LNISKTMKLRSYFPLRSIFGFLLANIVLAFIIMLAFMGTSYESLSHFLLTFAWSFAICATLWLGHGLIFQYLDKRISWLEKPVKRALWGLVALVAYSVVAFLFIQFLFHYLFYGQLPDVTTAWLIGNVIFPVVISFVISLIFTAIGFFGAWKNSFVQAEKLNALVLAYKYEVLRNQINPHFLFNSFNVLSDLVYEDQETAVKFIQQLSKLFRYVLDSRDKELVSLAEEMEFVRSFLFLLKIRLENKLIYETDVHTEASELIVPVSVQMLIENAVKHNEASANYPLKIKIQKMDDRLIVTNTIKPKQADNKSTMLGLGNLQQQFAFFTNKQLEITKSETEFRVSLPVIQHQNKQAP
jgi:two-component system, LytTR family, sensor kinase